MVIEIALFILLLSFWGTGVFILFKGLYSYVQYRMRFKIIDGIDVISRDLAIGVLINVVCWLIAVLWGL